MVLYGEVHREKPEEGIVYATKGLGDSQGNWVMGFGRNMEKVSVLHAELQAILDGLGVGWSRGFSNLWYEELGRCCRDNRMYRERAMKQLILQPSF